MWTASATGTREKYKLCLPHPTKPHPQSPKLSVHSVLPLPLCCSSPDPAPTPSTSLSSSPTPVPAGPARPPPPSACQVQLLRGERYTLMDNTDLHTWVVQGPGGETKTAPATCFCIPAPDPEAEARASGWVSLVTLRGRSQEVAAGSKHLPRCVSPATVSDC